MENRITEKRIAEATFRITGKCKYTGREVDTTVHALLIKGGGFDYGNGTCMVFEHDNGNDEVFDTRYERVNKDNFTEFALGVLRDRMQEQLTIETL